MHNSSFLFRSAIAAGLVFVASCGSDSATSPSTSSAELSAALSQTTLGDASTYSSASALTKVPGVAAPTFDPGRCTYSSDDNSFTCPAKSQSNVDFQLKYYLFDASGVAMSSYDAATTDRLRAVWDASGTFTTSGATAATVELEHHADFTLTGLLGTQRTLNGTSTDHDVLDSGSGENAVHAVLDVSGTATNLVVPAAAGEFPASGMLAADITASTTSGGFSTTANSRATLSFNGTKFGLLTVSSGSGTLACTIDLTGGTGPKC
jgi:hypothetical protein